MLLALISPFVIVSSALLIVFFVAAGAWLVGWLLIFPAHRAVGPAPPELGAVDVVLRSSSGAQVKGWWIPHPEARATILLFHGVRGDRRSMLGRARLLKKQGFSVLMIDFQSHGESRGSKITFGHLESQDVAAALAFARETNPDHTIGVIGSSLGGAASLLGDDRRYDALVLESVYTTIDEAIENRIRMRLGRLGAFLSTLLRLQIKPRLGFPPSRLRPIEYINKLQCPVLIASGDQDLHTTLDQTLRLFEAAPEPKELVIFKGAAHEDLLEHNPQLYEEKVVGFFHRYLLAQRDSASIPAENR